MRKDLLANIPTTPGVYQHIDSSGTIIYIGKAKHLRKRVRSYFSGQKDRKTTKLVSEIADIKTISTRNEVEALILENQLINKHKPKYNIMLRDNKRYAWICVTHEKFPRILTARTKKKNATYFGPYTDGTARRNIIIGLNKIFKLRTCRNLPKRVCLQYHIGNCTGPCEGHDTQEEYESRVEDAIEVLRGNTASVRKKFTDSMQQAAQREDFETAKQMRDTIHALEELEKKQVVNRQSSYDQDIISFEHNNDEAAFAVMHTRRGVMSGKDEFIVSYTVDVSEDFLRAYYRDRNPPREIITHGINEEEATVLEEFFSQKVESAVSITVPQRGEKKRLLELAAENAKVTLSGDNPALISLQNHLNMSSPPITIDCFDISNHQGSEIVGACVRYRNGQPEPTKYRKFKITSTDIQDDFASMKEAVQRRYASGDLPDLIVIDGGKGQLSAAQDGLRENGVNNPIISLAKQEEEVFVPGLSNSLPISQTDPGLLLLRRMRDAVHRFVITYHRKRRRKSMIQSSLDHIQGIGPKRKELLYEKFKTFEGIKQASLEELQNILGKVTGDHLYRELQ
jgi:excinuclease ABC subunit C